MANYEPFVWESTPPEGIPFKQSEEFKKIKFLGNSRHYQTGDTWYPTWASNDILYSGVTDGVTEGMKTGSGGYTARGTYDENGELLKKANTGNASLEGDDPLNLKVTAIGTCDADPYPYGGRYPCGGLVYNGVWYYGTYCLSPFGRTYYGDFMYNWPFLGPFVGYRTSTDYGKTWTDCPHTPEKPLFGETGMCGYPVKIGAPHFVDFGKNMEHSPDGKAYLVAQGSDLKFYPPTRFANLSWITADQVYLYRVTPSLETMNDPSAYEFYAGKDSSGNDIWTTDFKEMQPLLEWQNNMGAVTVTYNAPLKKYLMCVTDGVNTCTKMNTYILESESLTGEWKLVTYMKDFGDQAYFVNIPSKFISEEGTKMWLCYSGRFAHGWNGAVLEINPPDSWYGLVVQEIELL